MGHHEFKQLLFRLPLFKRGSILAEHEKVRGMQSLGRATGWPLVVQFQLVRLIKKLQNLSIILHCVDSPQFNGVAFKLDAHPHFAARVRSADIEETPLNSSNRRRRTKAKEEVTRGSRKLKPITPPLKGKGLHTLLFLMRPFPHGVLDTSAESIPNFETKNKVCDAFPDSGTLLVRSSSVNEDNSLDDKRKWR